MHVCVRLYVDCYLKGIKWNFRKKFIGARKKTCLLTVCIVGCVLLTAAV